MTNPGSFGSVVPRAHDWLERKVAAQEKRLNQLQTQRSLESAMVGKGGISIRGGAARILHTITGAVLILLDSTGLYINDGGTIVVNSGGSVNLNGGSDLLVDGDITLNGNLIADGGTLQSSNYVAGTSGWRLRPDGTVEINTAVIRGGIIGDDALTNPVSIDSYSDLSGGYAIPTTVGGMATARATVTITIPSGFTAVTIFAVAQDTGRNGTGFTSSLVSCVNVGSAGADYISAPGPDVEDTQGGASIVSRTLVRTGLTGGDTVSVQSRPFANGIGWPADSYNATLLMVLALFFR